MMVINLFKRQCCLCVIRMSILFSATERNGGLQQIFNFEIKLALMKKCVFQLLSFCAFLRGFSSHYFHKFIKVNWAGTIGVNLKIKKLCNICNFLFFHFKDKFRRFSLLKVSIFNLKPSWIVRFVFCVCVLVFKNDDHDGKDNVHQSWR